MSVKKEKVPKVIVRSTSNGVWLGVTTLRTKKGQPEQLSVMLATQEVAELMDVLDLAVQGCGYWEIPSFSEGRIT